MKLTPKQSSELKRFATHLMQCANTGVLGDDTAHALNALPNPIVLSGDDEPAFAEPRPYFATAQK